MVFHAIHPIGKLRKQGQQGVGIQDWERRGANGFTPDPSTEVDRITIRLPG